ncbi:MAG: hypothetical protein ACRCUS_10385, partial [Anaerovoracaceae bacterium]
EYGFMPTGSLKDADLVCVPKEESRISKEQAKDILLAGDLGIDVRVIDSEKLLKEKIGDVLGLGKEKPLTVSRELEL